MKGLLLKDIYVISKQLKIILFIATFLIILNSTDLAFFVSLLFATLPMTSISYDNQSKWDNLAVMMPYSKKQLVISKYLLGYIGIIGTLLFAYLINTLIISLGFDIAKLYLFSDLMILQLSSTLVFIGINTLIIFKFGVEKGRIIFICTMGVLGSLNGPIKNLDPNLLIKILEAPSILFLITAIIINIISIVIAINIKSK